MRYLKYVLIGSIAALFTSCGDPDLPFDLDESLENTGGYVRVVTVENAGFDVDNLQDAAYIFVAEVGDNENGNLSESIEFFARYFPAGVTNPADNPFVEVPLPQLTVQVSSLSISDQSELPRGTFTVPLSDVVDAYGSDLDFADIEVGDRVDIRWKLNMKDGREYTNDDVNASITGGFYRSPFFARASVVFVIPENLFVGSYTFEAQNTGVFGWWTFSEVFEAELTVDPDNTLNGRIFTAEPYAVDWGGLDPINVPIQLGFIAGYGGPGSGTGSGLGCGVGLAIGRRVDTTSLNELDRADDSQFTLRLADNVRSDCGAPPVDVNFTVTKN